MDRPSNQLDALTKANQALQAEIAGRREAEEELRLLLAVTRALAEAQDFRSASKMALREICEQTGWDYGEIWLPSANEEALQFEVAWHRENEDLDQFRSFSQSLRFAPGLGLPGKVWQTKRSKWLQDIAIAPEEFVRCEIAKKFHLKSALGIPVIGADKATAVLGFLMFESRPEDKRLVEMVSHLAAQLGALIQRRRAEEELCKARAELEVRVEERTVALESEIAERRRVDEEMHTRVRQQAAVAQIGQRALSGAQLSVLLEEACALVARTLDVEFCKVLELLPDGQALRLRAGVGWKEGLVGRSTVNVGLQSQAGYTLDCGKPVLVEDLRTETRFNGPALLRDHGVVSGMSVIIPGRDRPFGILGAHTVTRRTFRSNDVYFLEGVANVLSAAIERGKSGEEMLRGESWLHNLIATTQDAVLSIDRRGCVVLFNPAAEGIFGYAAEEIVGHKVNELMAEPYASEHDKYIARYERTGEARAIGRIRTVTAKRKNGELFPIELSVTEIEVDQDVHYAAFIRDISEKVKLQGQLVERERLATIGTTAAKIGHELANPLNGMSLTIQLLEQRLSRQPSPPDRQATATVQRLRKEISRLNQLAGQFRTISRRERYDFQPTELAGLIDEVIRIQRPHFAQLNIEIYQLIPTDLPTVTVDKDKIKQALLNLVKNAAEAMPGGGKINIEACATEDGVLIDITDTGTGIPLDIDAFEPFMTTKKEGTGIGLVIVRQIVTAHGGNISYRSRPGEGTTFRIELSHK